MPKASFVFYSLVILLFAFPNPSIADSDDDDSSSSGARDIICWSLGSSNVVTPSGASTTFVPASPQKCKAGSEGGWIVRVTGGDNCPFAIEDVICNLE